MCDSIWRCYPDIAPSTPSRTTHPHRLDSVSLPETFEAPCLGPLVLVQPSKGPEEKVCQTVLDSLYCRLGVRCMSLPGSIWTPALRQLTRAWNMNLFLASFLCLDSTRGSRSLVFLDWCKDRGRQSLTVARIAVQVLWR